MPDTSDVAKVLFEWMFGKKPDDHFGIFENYEAPQEVQGMTDAEVVAKLETLSNLFRIGIEDARRLLRLAQEE